MNRLNFIKTTSIAAVALLTQGFSYVNRNILYADGKTCDSKALAAWFKGEKVYTPEGKLLNAWVMKGKTFYINNSINVLSSRKYKMITNCNFVMGKECRYAFIADKRNEGKVWISHCHFSSHPSQRAFA